MRDETRTGLDSEPQESGKEQEELNGFKETETEPEEDEEQQQVESYSETETDSSLFDSEQESCDSDNDSSEDDNESSSPEDENKVSLENVNELGQSRSLDPEDMPDINGNLGDLRDEKVYDSKTQRQENLKDYDQTQQKPDDKEKHKSVQPESQRNAFTGRRQRELCQSDSPLRLRLTLKHYGVINKTSACKNRDLTERQNESNKLKIQGLKQYLEEEREEIQKRDMPMEQQKEDESRMHQRCQQEMENYRSQIRQLKQELDQTRKDRDEQISLFQEKNKELVQKTNDFELEIKSLIRDLENERKESKTNEALILIEDQNIQLECYRKDLILAKEETAAKENLLNKTNTENFQVSKQLKKALEDVKEKDDLLKKKTAEMNVARESEVESKRKIHALKTKLRAVVKELEETKSRLSRVMGDRLTDNNPNIADLSDKNRPTKLSERYQELYDNQWTDAFEQIHQEAHDEERTIEILKSIIMHASEFCKEEAKQQLNQMAEVFAKGKELPASILKPLKDIRKALAPEYGKVLFKDYFEHLSESGSELSDTVKEIPSFVKECFEICWLMKVQDPPVVLGPSPKTGESFNKDHYKAYTKSGDHVSFIVWPALLLHQDGPVLCKGVAQGK